MNKSADIAIIGPGKVGTAIGVLAAKAGWTVAAVGGRDAARAAAAAKAIGPHVRAATAAQAAGSAELVLLTVGDDDIAATCQELAAAFRPGAIVAHCSGVLGSEVLAPARSRGCRVGSMHPLQTFPSLQAAIKDLPGAYCFIEGDAEAAESLQRLAEAIGAHPVPIASAAKAVYHAAAVMACNYLTALLDAALALCNQAGIDEPTARKALGPLARATLDNVLAAGTAGALTGPIARGDQQTVQRHLGVLMEQADLLDIYRALGRWTVALAARKGTINSSKAAALRRLLDFPLAKE
ncbi:MAG: DUF2520 domain-containing protein [Phycisphaerae bacterium]|jgi:predicted short-subunit dehydrogenase-like oxidoreductase (DUF2520 family)